MTTKDQQRSPSAIAGVAGAICCSLVWLGAGVLLLLIPGGAG